MALERVGEQAAEILTLRSRVASLEESVKKATDKLAEAEKEVLEMGILVKRGQKQREKIESLEEKIRELEKELLVSQTETKCYKDMAAAK